MYSSVQSNVSVQWSVMCQVNGQCSEEFGMGVCVHQGSVLNPLLLIRRTVTEVDVSGTMLDVDATICDLGDILCSGGDCDSAIGARCCML